MSKNRVFVGPGNIAGSAMSIANSLRLIGINAKSFSYNSHPFGYACDRDNILFNNPFKKPKERNLLQKIAINKYTLSIIWTVQKLLLFFQSIILYDTFIFISHETFFGHNKDLGILKKLNKKIAFLFVGCPERDPKDSLNQRDRGLCSFCADKDLQNYLNCHMGDKKKKKIQYISEMANYIFAHRDTSSFILDKSKIEQFYCSTAINLDKESIYKKFGEIDKLIITHLPTNKLLKGTETVDRTVIELIEKGYKIQYISKQVLHSAISEILDKTHILIDQFTIGPGLLAVEGMAHGCIVICRTSVWFKEDFPELPVVSCEPEELKSILIELMSNPLRMLEIAIKSFEYYQKFHTPEVVGNYYKKTLKLR